ncbi:MAG: DUF349 domain-containing protein [Bacteroidales bacterium]|nr:DUF349 domain-containing protein [Bacteroidales bacterium]
MNNEDQLNQNPEAIVAQEENSIESNALINTQSEINDKVEFPEKTIPAAVITAEEKNLLIGLIQPDQPIVVETPEEVVTQKIEILPVVDAKSDSITPVQDSVDNETVVSKTIISIEERKQVIGMIGSDQMIEEAEHEDDDESESHPFEFENLNKLQLVELLEETVLDADVAVIKAKVAAIKVRFLKLNKDDIDAELEKFILDGGNKEEYSHTDEPLEIRFKAAFNKYKENKAHHNELLERKKVENLREKSALLDELKMLISSEETLKKTYDEFKILQDKWKSIGQVPAGEITNLWNNYHFLVEKFFDKVKINKELRDLDLKKNLEAKIELCERAEELLLEPSVIKSFKMLQKFHDDWKEIGPVPQDKKDEIWERFKNATDKINLIRREHYSKIQEEQQHHYEAKIALCEKMEEIAAESSEGISDWNAKSDQVSELFKVWRSVGQAPKKLNDDIWNRFKTSMDVFFDNKKEFFGKIKDQQLENYNLKLDLCAQAEALKDSDEWRKATDQFKMLQEEWKKIGPVPRKNSEKVWKRFRSACDTFFSRKSEFFNSIRDVESDNLKLKKDLITMIQDFTISKEKQTNLDALKTFQRPWMEIGHVPMKVKDQLQVQYRKAIDSLFEKMKLTELEMTATEYKGMIEGMRDEPESQERIRRERFMLTNKVAKLREEINLWENNIGFFASSKNADLMKAEYEKKINKAKVDLKVLEAKIKILKD